MAIGYPGMKQPGERKENSMRLMAILLVVGQLAIPYSSWSQDSHTAKLLEGAKKQGALVWYTSTSVEDITRLSVSSSSSPW